MTPKYIVYQEPGCPTCGHTQSHNPRWFAILDPEVEKASHPDEVVRLNRHKIGQGDFPLGALCDLLCQLDRDYPWSIVETMRMFCEKVENERDKRDEQEVET